MYIWPQHLETVQRGDPTTALAQHFQTPKELNFTPQMPGIDLAR